MSSMLEWAEEELKRYNFDFYDDNMNKAVLEVLKVLSDQGHTNMSASIVISLVDRLWSWKPLTPLTGEDDEWTDNLDPTGNTWQNKRYSAVFKNKETGKCYDIEGRIFAEPDGATFTCRQSKVAIEFPYMPPDKYPVYQLKYTSDEKSVEEQLKDGDYEVLQMEEIVYFELNNWFPGIYYPNEYPFNSWLSNDLGQRFLDKDWVKENRLCVLFQILDMSFNYLITAPKTWVEKNCPSLLTKNRGFLRFPKDGEELPIGRTGEYFLAYKPENIGITEGEEW